MYYIREFFIKNKIKKTKNYMCFFNLARISFMKEKIIYRSDKL
ncbi:hypothetical protein CNEO4_910008 [Clostridium neonatale]|uniref:Uncharacterized protein n=1 Tax=Clostridium neonatale TaxID=137838 RepID=A0AA86JIW1_9CLOT|nr:hypothetical protein CNEO_43934 [Clostridium neonatale]CAI3562090.1 hypothetical protein CNEO3_240064 [Clostridium neonatale]CAI3568136.1 hypothetical protein CNEO3_130102 [Clostridium neonatale]CAI3606595.1 hypothetical protein CNEO3_170076 [Clostridium neonatale]CAI3645058.1 hypothetical protein CNEO3_280055 [Clostridium neonatale]